MIKCQRRGGSVRILHTADWHLGKTIAFTNFDLLPVQEKVLQKIVNIGKNESVDLVIIAGDIFDSANPSGKAERLFTATLKKFADHNCPVFIVAGNHDSPERLSALNPLAQENLVFIGGFVKEDFSGIDVKKGKWGIKGHGRFILITDHEKNESAVVQLLPYASEYRLGEVFYSRDDASELEYAEKLKELMHVPIPFDADYRILISHLYAGGGKSHTNEEKPLFIGGSYLVPVQYFSDLYSYVALGHLHSAQKVSQTIAYSGSILPLIPGPHEKEKYIQIVDLSSKTSVTKIPIGLDDFLEMRVVDAIEKALMPISGGRALYICFQSINAPLTSADIREIMKQHGEKLASIRVELADSKETGAAPQLTNTDELSTEEWFRRFYQYKKSIEPQPEVMELYRRLINREAAE
jgi:exonuclease SbcD